MPQSPTAPALPQVVIVGAGFAGLAATRALVAPLSSAPAGLLRATAHVHFLIGRRNRAIVAFTWSWSYLTFERGVRLITGPAPSPPALASSRPTGR